MSVKWACSQCGYEVERAEGKLPPVGDPHDQKDADGSLMAYGMTPQCEGTEFRKVP